MIHLNNEMGNVLPSAEQQSVHEWIKFRYPHQLAEQVKKYREQSLSGIENPVITFEGSIANNLDFVTAVRFFVQADKTEKDENILSSSLS